MTTPLAPLHEALDALAVAWRGDGAGDIIDVSALGGARLIAVNEALSLLRRQTDAVHAAVAAEIARESRPELGADSLSKQQGFRNSTALIAATTGASTGDAARMVKVGEATAPRSTLTGEALPARHPHVAEALKSGKIGMPAASAIITMLDRVSIRADRTESERAELLLVTQAAGLNLDQLAKLIVRAEAHLDPDGLEPKERDARGERSLRIFERDGAVHLNGIFDIESGASVKIAIAAFVMFAFNAARNAESSGDLDADRRSIAQLQADALALMAQHVLGCEHGDSPLRGATMVVRLGLDDLVSGEGHATIDGIDQPVSVATARRMAAGGGVIPCVLGDRGEVLDWGRERRLFSKSQRLALVERDGGCAGCGVPPGMTRAHHILWWIRDHGPTDLANAVLLCDSCHHRVHDNGWEIRIEDSSVGAKVWFIPPAHVDPDRTPRLGGRARFDFDAQLLQLSRATELATV